MYCSQVKEWIVIAGDVWEGGGVGSRKEELGSYPSSSGLDNVIVVMIYSSHGLRKQETSALSCFLE